VIGVTATPLAPREDKSTMQQQTYILVPDLAAATEVPANGILSKTI
jgi:hypothetical protein